MAKSKQQKAAELAAMKAMFYGGVGAYYVSNKTNKQ
jgi:hypothetical protein